MTISRTRPELNGLACDEVVEETSDVTPKGGVEGDARPKEVRGRACAFLGHVTFLGQPLKERRQCGVALPEIGISPGKAPG